MIGGKHFHHTVEWNKRYGNPLALKARAKPKDPSQHKVVGKSFPQKVVTEKVLGRTGLAILERAAGLLLVAIAVQFMMDGIAEGLPRLFGGT